MMWRNGILFIKTASGFSNHNYSLFTDIFLCIDAFVQCICVYALHS